jgi:transposase
MARDQTIDTDVVSNVAKPYRPRRIEVLSGGERRRTWPDETRIAIVAPEFEPGEVVSHIARRHDINPSQLFGWINKSRTAVLARRTAKPDAGRSAFAPAILDLAAPIAATEMAAHEPASNEIRIGPATVRIRGAVDAKTLALHQPPPSDPTPMLVHGGPLCQTERGRRSALKARRRPCDEAGHKHFWCRWSIAQ